MNESPSIVLITGATAGIGRHAALHLAGQGHRVIATGRNPRLLDELKAEAGGLRLDVVRLDVSDAGSVSAAAAEVNALTQGHGVDVLVNNAGYGLGALLADVTDEELRAQFETNVFGLMRVTWAFLPTMMARGCGRIINVGSVAGRLTTPLTAAYSSTKYAVESLSDALRMELRPFGIEVSVIEPGPIRSEFAGRMMEHLVRHGSAESPYAAIYARADELARMHEVQASGPEHVSRAIEHAAFARRPRVRYVVPSRQRLVLLLAAVLPTRLTDYLLCRVLGLTPAGLRAAV
jgi:short-subunit dehydrogenase